MFIHTVVLSETNVENPNINEGVGLSGKYFVVILKILVIRCRTHENINFHVFSPFLPMD